MVFVVDASGSMHGRPFEQAKKAIEAGIAALRPHGRLSIVAFPNETEALSSCEYGLASRVMALVAVVQREADKPGELPKTQVVPVGLPQDLAERIAASLDLLERLLDHGSSRAKGPFRHHVRRLLEFLGDVVLDKEQRTRLAKIVAGTTP